MDLPFNTATVSLLTVAYIIIFLVALSANILLVYIVFKRPSLKTTINYLFTNIAVFNLLVAVFIMPYSVRHLFVANAWFNGVLGQISCRFIYFLYGISTAGFVLTLIGISLNQFYAILFPSKIIALIRNTRLLTCMIWILSVVLMSPYLALYGVKEISRQHQCIYVVANRVIIKIHFSCLFVFLYVCPLSLLTILYIFTCRKLWFRTLPGNIHSIHRHAVEMTKRRVIRMLIVVIATFASCWLPVHVFYMYMAFENDGNVSVDSDWSLFIMFFSHANNAVNPCLIMALNRKFRAELIKLCTTNRTPWMRCLRRTGHEESGCQTDTRLTKMRKFQAVENLAEGIARKRGRLYDLNLWTNACSSSPVSLVQFTYCEDAPETEN